MIYGWQGYSEKKPEFEQGRDFTKATFYLKGKEVKRNVELDDLVMVKK